MDDLEFRRTLYANPQANDEAVAAALRSDPSKLEFVQEIRNLDAKLQTASRVSVPEDLAHKLILRQTIDSHAQKQNRKNRWYLGIAASVALMLSLAFPLWLQGSAVNLGQHALAHVYHEAPYIPASGNALPLEEINAKLASIGGHMDSDVGKLISAKFCHFEHIKSLHLVMQQPNGQISIFVIPNQGDYQLEQQFSDASLHGKGIKMQNTNLIMVADKAQDLEQVSEQFRQAMAFSA